MKLGAISPSFKLMMNLMGSADVYTGTGLKKTDATCVRSQGVSRAGGAVITFG